MVSSHFQENQTIKFGNVQFFYVPELGDLTETKNRLQSLPIRLQRKGHVTWPFNHGLQQYEPHRHHVTTIFGHVIVIS